MDYLLGLDVGTTGCKAALYGLDGKLAGAGYRSYAIKSEKPGWAEEDPEEWWAGIIAAIGDCVSGCKDSKPAILAISVSGTNALVPVDRQGKVLHPAIMQLDMRTTPICMDIADIIDEDTAFFITGNRIAPGTVSAPTILWLMRERPEVYKSTFKFLSPTGFIVQRLTGAFTMDYTRASTTLLFDIRKREWSKELCDALEVDEKKLPRLYAPDDVAGRLTGEAASLTGLSKGITVAAGLMDTAAAALGLGCTNEKEPFLILGTVSRLCVPMKDPSFSPVFFNACFAGDVPYLAMAPTNGGGISKKWFLDVFCQQEKAHALDNNKNPYELLDMLARQAPKGSKGLIYLPYIAAERSPIWDSYARGVFFGISHAHKREHFARSVLEGVALATRHTLGLMEQMQSCRFENIVFSGGGAKSALWASIITDVLQRRLLLKEEETETKGAAFIAGKAAGVYTSYPNKEKRQTDHVLIPDENDVELYESLFQIYLRLYQSLKSDFVALDEFTRKYT